MNNSNKKEVDFAKKEVMEQELKRRNYQYGLLSNKYAELKYKFLEFKKILDNRFSETNEIDKAEWDELKKQIKIAGGNEQNKV